MLSGVLHLYLIIFTTSLVVDEATATLPLVSTPNPSPDRDYRLRWRLSWCAYYSSSPFPAARYIDRAVSSEGVRDEDFCDIWLPLPLLPYQSPQPLFIISHQSSAKHLSCGVSRIPKVSRDYSRPFLQLSRYRGRLTSNGIFENRPELRSIQVRQHSYKSCGGSKMTAS